MTAIEPPLFAVTVEFEVDPANEAEFMALLHENAADSVRLEPGCVQFDLMTFQPRPDRAAVFLYEIYADRSAFDLHLGSDHFKRFDDLTRMMVREKVVRTFAVFRRTRGMA